MQKEAILKDRLARLKEPQVGEDTEIDDLRLVFFGSVLYGTQIESMIQPLPLEFMVPGTIKPNIPILARAYERIACESVDSVFRDPKAVSLLDTIFNRTKYQLIRSSMAEIEEKSDEVKTMFDALPDTSKPAHVFKVKPYEISYKDELFDGFKEDHGTFFGFHGTKMKAVRSVIDYGLCSIFNQREAYGPGVYFADHINTTFYYSTFDNNRYQSSRFGRQLAPVLMCEIINHPKLKSNTTKPQGFHVIPNADWIRIDSLLLFNNPDTRPQPT